MNTTERAQNLRHQLNIMIDNKNWVGICEMHQKQKQQQQQQRQQLHTTFDTNVNTANANTNGIEEEVAHILISNNRLPCELLKVKEDMGTAKALFLMLVTSGGKEYVMRRDFYLGGEYGLEEYGTILHLAAKYDTSREVVLRIIEVGGRDFVVEKDGGGWTSLHCAFDYNASINVVKGLIDVGGRDLIWERVGRGWTSLHYACYNNASFDVVKELIEVGGGRDIVLEKDGGGRTPLHIACNNLFTSPDVLDLLIQHGGRDILRQVNNDGKTPLHVLITRYWSDEEEKRAFVEKASVLISKGIELQIGGQYSIGGLFNHNIKEQVQDEIYENWDENVLPALEQIMAQPNNQRLPILHALIKHGIQWENGTRIIFEKSDQEVLETTDTLTGLYPFMMAAAVDGDIGYDLNSSFNLVKACPHLVKQLFGANNNEEKQFLRKRKRC